MKFESTQLFKSKYKLNLKCHEFELGYKAQLTLLFESTCKLFVFVYWEGTELENHDFTKMK